MFNNYPKITLELGNLATFSSTILEKNVSKCLISLESITFFISTTASLNPHESTCPEEFIVIVFDP